VKSCDSGLNLTPVEYPHSLAFLPFVTAPALVLFD